MEAPAISSSMLPPKQDAELRKQIGEFIGITFYGTMMKTMHNSDVKGKYGHGGRGEEVFQSQLDFELAKRMGHSQNNSLAEALYNRLTGGSGIDRATLMLRSGGSQTLYDELGQQAQRRPRFER